jgi:putative ABC transport system permease protein
MYIIKNAIKNIGRNKGRNILTAIIIFAIILTIVVSITINTTTSKIIEDYKSRFGSEVSIVVDENKLLYGMEYKPLTAEQQLAFGDSDLLKSKSLSSTMPIIPDGLKSLDDEQGTEISGPSRELLSPKAMLIGSDSDDISEDFKNGLRSIIDGKIYENENECLISEQYAELNNLSVGDEITIKSIIEDSPMPQKLTISGIFSDRTMVGNTSPFKYAEANRNNEILVSLDTATNLEMFKKTIYGQVVGEFVLNSPDELEAFEKEVRSKGLADYYKVTTDEATYNKIVGPVEGLSQITNTFLIVVLVLGSAILVLLSVLSIRERKYEIGVLRAMGMKKAKLALGLLTESIVITAICLCIGLGVGSLASQPVANSMLQSQIEIVEQNEQNGSKANLIQNQNQSTEKPLSDIDVSLNGEAILKIILISLALAGVSSLVGILYITKYEPMKILSERN